jgi:RecA/RadA recombinase
MAILKELEVEYAKSGLFASDDMGFSYPLGFPILDQQLGFVQHIELEDGSIHEQIRLGVPAGTFTQFIGPSSSGKTAAAIQAAWNIVEPYGEEAVVLHFDAEVATEPQRILDLTGINVDTYRTRYKLFKDQSKMTFEATLEIINELCKKKDSDKSRYTYNTGFKDIYGRDIIHYVPTAVIIDSQMRIVPESVDLEQMSGMTEAARNAIQRGNWYRNLLALANKYNINFIVVNHLGNDMDMAGKGSKAKQLTFIPTGKNVPGGDKAVYYTSSFVLFQPVNSKDGIKHEETEGYNGLPVRASVCKSRSGAGGHTAILEFIQEAGFDPKLTLLNFAREKGMISGRNPKCYFTNYPDVTFDTRVFLKEMTDNPDIIRTLFKECKPELRALLRKPADADDLLRGSNSKVSTRDMMRELL